MTGEKKISAVIFPQKSEKRLTIEVKIENIDTGKPITGLTLNDFEINGKDANGYLEKIEEIKPGIYLPTIKDQFPGIINPKKRTKLYEFDHIVCKMIQIDLNGS